MKDAPPRIYDRLPNAEIIGKSDVLDLSRSLSGAMYYFKAPFREFVSQEFILGQGKSYGIDVQKPVYFFGNRKKDKEGEEWGIIANVIDSSKILAGLKNLEKVVDINDSLIGKQRVFIFGKKKLHLTYGKDWILLYAGEKFKSRLAKIVQAKRNEITPRWRNLLNDKTFRGSKTVANILSPELNEYGIQSAFFSVSNDSTSLTFHTKMIYEDSLPFKLKNEGPSFPGQDFTKNLINLHVDVDYLKRHPESKLFQKLKNLGAKVSFPFISFLDAWGGDIAFRQGGIQTIQEQYIESEFDENFNVTEVVKFKDVKIPGYSLFISFNGKGKAFVNQLFTKGIMTNDGDKYRVLFSPPMKMRLDNNSLLLHTSNYPSKLVKDSSQQVIWSIKHNPVHFSIEKTTTKMIYGKINIPLEKIIKSLSGN